MYPAQSQLKASYKYSLVYKNWYIKRKASQALEPVLPLSIVLGLLGGAASAVLTFGKRFEELDKAAEERIVLVDQRVDGLEIRLAKEYIQKQDLAHMLERLDSRMDRMDYKLDQILIGYNKSAPHGQLNGPY